MTSFTTTTCYASKKCVNCTNAVGSPYSNLIQVNPIGDHSCLLLETSQDTRERPSNTNSRNFWLSSLNICIFLFMHCWLLGPFYNLVIGVSTQLGYLNSNLVLRWHSPLNHVGKFEHFVKRKRCICTATVAYTAYRLLRGEKQT